MTTRIVTDANGRKHITNEPLLHPPQRTWVGLTDKDLYEIYNKANWDVRQSWDYERAIEAKLREKNT